MKTKLQRPNAGEIAEILSIVRAHGSILHLIDVSTNVNQV
jgi:hypothetical protein